MTEERSGKRRWLTGDAYTVSLWLIFAAAIVYIWRPYVRDHEAIYLLGSRRVVDPGFLSLDLTWGVLPPTTFAYDHLLAPLWSVFDDFGIVAFWRLVAMFLLAWSLASLARAMRLPAWSMVVGFAIWMLWRQTLAACGKPIEGLQPKSLAYPMIFLSLAYAIRGQALRAGIVSGIGTLFHIIVGGWSCLALCLTMIVNRRLFSLRQLAAFLLATAPFIGPLVLAVAFFHSAGVTSGEQALMDEIYVTFAQPVCTDPTYFMNSERWLRAAILLPLAPVLLFLWPQRDASRIVGCFVVLLIVFFGLGLLATWLDLYWFMKVYPFQLANSIPALFLFVMCLALIGKNWPQRLPGRLAWGLCFAVAAWTTYERDVFTKRVFDVPGRFASSLERVYPGRFGERTSRSLRDVSEWIRQETPEDSVFITPPLYAFWTYAERAQVAAFRHPPHDRKLIAWKERLEALNGFQPFKQRGGKSQDELGENERRLTIADLIRIRERYGATHYLTRRKRSDLQEHWLHSARIYHVYDIRELEPNT